MIDALLQLSVVDRDLASPPGSPTDADRYIVAAAAGGAWAGHEAEIAAWQDGAWAFYAPRPGWLAWIEDEARLVCHDGTDWIDAAQHSVNPTPLVGVNATADATNRLAVKSLGSLFDHAGSDHRMAVNKASASNTASILFQTGYSGRAEFGLAGDDNWRVKVSADGSSWTEALRVDAASGLVRMPAALALSDDNQVVAKRHIRDKLTANRVYYVRTDGNDANSGLVNSAGGAFLTLQAAYNHLARNIDLGGFTATIQQGTAGTLTAGLSITQPVVGGNLVVVNLGGGTLSVTGGICIANSAQMFVTVSNGTITNSGTNVDMLRATASGARITLGSGITFGSSGGSHMTAINGGYIDAQAGATINGGSTAYASGLSGGTVALGPTAISLGKKAITNFAAVSVLGLVTQPSAVTGQACTVSIASPGVVTQAAHGLSANDPVIIKTNGALPTGITAGTNYFVKTVLDANSFTISATAGGTVIDTTGTQSGTHNAFSVAGRKYFAATNSVINVYGAGITALPGDLAGISNTGSQYA